MVSEHASPLAVLGGVDAGGQNVHVAELARVLGRLGVEVTVHTRRDSEELPEWVRFAPGVLVHHVDAGPPQTLVKDELLPYMDAFARHLERVWRRRRPDVVHAHFWMSAYAALQAAERLGIPVVQTFHALGVVKRRYQGEKDTSPPERLAIERRIVEQADGIVATCTDEVFELLRLGAERSRLTVIPCGVDLSLFRPDGPRARRRAGMQRLLTVGRLVERKGIGNVVSALPALPGVELVVAGGPERERLACDPEARRLRDLAEAEGVADRVRLLGRVEHDQVPALMRSADAVVSVPWYEPFGITPVEAMACGVPIVASAVGGMIDTVLDGVTGVQVAPRDPERLAEALAGLLGDPERRAAYGRAGVERAKRFYDWERIGTSTLAVYEKLARARRAASARSGRLMAGVRVAPDGHDHLRSLTCALEGFEQHVDRVEQWGVALAGVLLDGGRLLTVGNGGSAAQAQHLTAELVGRYQAERAPVSALCLHADTSSLTAICNDYGAEEAFARQVYAHGRPGDALLALSTSGESANVLAAVRAAREIGMRVWGLCGEESSSLARECDDALCVPSCSTATVQEVHMVAIHTLCGAVECELLLREPSAVRGEPSSVRREPSGHRRKPSSVRREPSTVRGDREAVHA
jgi:glycosyltransferase involved in cell wall biosynthesis/phosphoheptose isomerase